MCCPVLSHFIWLRVLVSVSHHKCEWISTHSISFPFLYFFIVEDCKLPPTTTTMMLLLFFFFLCHLICMFSHKDSTFASLCLTTQYAISYAIFNRAENWYFFFSLNKKKNETKRFEFAFRLNWDSWSPFDSFLFLSNKFYLEPSRWF